LKKVFYSKRGIKMGTRSMVYFEEIKDGKKVVYVVIYQQYDGYKEGVGLKLAKFLSSRTLVNGFSSEHKKHETANGLGCLAAQYIAHVKDGVGGFYLCPANSEPGFGIEWCYTVALYPDKGLRVHVDDGNKALEMSVPQFLSYCNE
jgi:hypothetical protein